MTVTRQHGGLPTAPAIDTRGPASVHNRAVRNTDPAVATRQAIHGASRHRLEITEPDHKVYLFRYEIADTHYNPSVLTNNVRLIITAMTKDLEITISTEDVENGGTLVDRMIEIKDESGNAGIYGKIRIGLENYDENAGTGLIDDDRYFYIDCPYGSVTLSLNGANGGIN